MTVHLVCSLLLVCAACTQDTEKVSKLTAPNTLVFAESTTSFGVSYY